MLSAQMIFGSSTPALRQPAQGRSNRSDHQAAATTSGRLAYARSPTRNEQYVVPRVWGATISVAKSDAPGSRPSTSTAVSASEGLVTDPDAYQKALEENKVLLVDWMARWCRKCIYLRPKLEKFVQEEFPSVPLLMIDVNAVPGKVVYGAGVRKMPTIQLYVNGEKVAEHIASEGGLGSIDKVRTMLHEHLDKLEGAAPTVEGAAAVS